jgi:hypothetical protein
MRSGFFVMIALLAVACASSADRSGPTAPNHPATPAHEQVTELLEKLAADLEINQLHCDKVATALLGWAQDYRERYPELERRAAAAALDDKVRAESQGRIERALNTVVTTVLGCSDHPATQEAFAAADALLDSQHAPQDAPQGAR